MEVKFIIPCYNAAGNLPDLFKSLYDQKSSKWSAILIDDMSEDRTYDCATEYSSSNIEIIKNTEKKYALRNIVENARRFQKKEDIIIAVIDGDDSLCNPDTVDLLLDSYDKGYDVVWTGHRWDINDMNISKPMPENVDPYSYTWSSSHLRTFRADLLEKVKDINFKDTSGSWFMRGYDQALMLPIIHVSEKRHYIDEICYRYNINSVSIPYRDYSEMTQISTINLVRSRGFLE